MAAMMWHLGGVGWLGWRWKGRKDSNSELGKKELGKESKAGRGKVKRGTKEWGGEGRKTLEHLVQYTYWNVMANLYFFIFHDNKISFDRGRC